MPRPLTVTDDEIHETARAVFLEQGSSASTSTIAERLGISQPALHKRVGSKEALLLDTLGPPPRGGNFERSIGDPDPAADPVEQLEALALRLYRIFREAVPGLLVLRSAGLPLDRVLPPRTTPPPVRVRRAVARWLDRARELGLVRTCDSTAVAETFVGGIEARCFLEYLGGERTTIRSARRHLSDLVSVLWKGVEP